jgi:uncharacterized RDD family membrane protein YckC
VAVLLDWIYCWWPLFLAGVFSSAVEASFPDPGQADDMLGVVCIVALTASAVLVLRNLSRLMNTGQTWGKHKMNLLVIKADGHPAPSSTLFWRTLGPYLMMFIPIANFVTYFDAWLILGPSKQCIHDRLVGTIVVEADSYEAPPAQGTGLTPTYDDIGFSRFN